jgi:hypothetical protein
MRVPARRWRRRLGASAYCMLVLMLFACGPRDGDAAFVPSSTPGESQTARQAPTETVTGAYSATDTVTPEVSQQTSTAVPATDTPVTATATQIPPTETPAPRPTPTRRPSVPTATLAVPTETPKPAVDFKVIEERMLSLKENQGSSKNGSVRDCGLLHIYLIKVVDKGGVPLANILVRRLYAGNVEIPPTGSKGPGMSEDVPPRYAGDQLFVMGDTGGARYTSEQTRVLSLNDRDIPNSDLIAGGYCRDDAECSYRKANNLLCLGHYSYSIVFQRQW